MFGPLDYPKTRRVFLVGFSAFALSLSGCGRSESKRKEDSKLHLHWLVAAILVFRERKGEYPVDLASLSDLFRENTGDVRLDAARDNLLLIGVGSFDGLLRNPRTGDKPGYRYEAPQSDVSSEPIILQLQKGAPMRDKTAAYLDGTVR